MTAIKCYIPNKEDAQIAEVLDSNPLTRGLFNKYRVAALRGMYDAENQDSPLDVSNLENAAKSIIAFSGEISRRSFKEITSKGTNYSKNFKDLKRDFNSEELYNRVNMITLLFSSVVDNYVKSNKGLSRQDVLKGFTKNGKSYLGEFAIFDQVYRIMMNRMSMYLERGETEKAKKVEKVLDHWPALAVHSRARLRNSEGIKVGNKLSFSEETSELNYSDNDLSHLFNADEAPREHWMTTHGLESSFGTIGQQVRRVLGSIPEMVEVLGEETTPDGATHKTRRYIPKVDDLDTPITLDPVNAHQKVLDIIRGARTEAAMIRQLRRAVNGNPWLSTLIKALESDPQLRTMFYVDMARNFQLYGAMKIKGAVGKIKEISTFILNKIEDILTNSLYARVSLGHVLNAENSIYDKDGIVIGSKVIELFKKIQDFTTTQVNTSSDDNIFSGKRVYGGSTPFKLATPLEKREFLVDVLTSLGIDADADTIDSIVNSPKSADTYDLINLLQSLTLNGIPRSVADVLEEGKKEIKYLTLIELKKSKSDEKPFLEHIKKINTILTEHREGLRFESKAKRKNSKGDTITHYSHVTSSFMGDMFDTIKSYVEVNDKENLLAFLEKQYLCSPFFVDSKGNILNKWLEELVKCTDEKAPPLQESFAAKFAYMRFLGDEVQDFENFTSKQHIISMLAKYREHFEQSKGKSELRSYPVFILGDSGVSKYITAKHYSKEDILEGMYNIYIQELQRQKLVKEANFKLDSSGHKRIKHFSKTEKVFVALPFLNEAFKNGTLSEESSKEDIKKVIEDYLKDSTEKFKKQLDNLGVLEKDEEGKKYVYFGNRQGNNINEEISDYYWNTKFATLQQFQLMTIDTSFYDFYKNTKDLQKRYKEIHAPGKSLSLDAVDVFATPIGRYADGAPIYPKYSDSGIETAIYFDEHIVGADDSFLKVIESIYDKDSDIYKKYASKNKATDGQGYRTLTSYRKVLGMTGEWNSEMERAYSIIMDIRNNYTKKNMPIPEDQLARIKEVAVVFQPIKPFMFTHEMYPIGKDAKGKDTYLPIPVQHKYAEAVLIPELLNDGKLKDMALWMEKNNVDIAGSTEIVKVGCFGQVDISNVNGKEELEAALDKAYVHKLDYSGYRIQTNVPEHINSSQLFGTQLRKLIMAGLNMTGDYSSYVGGKKVNLGGTIGEVNLNGTNLISFYNSLIVSNILESLNEFRVEISKTNAISNSLIQGVINNDREALDNLLAYALDEIKDSEGNKIGEELAIPLFEGGLEHDSSALLLSIFKRTVLKQLIKGGSLVQVSSMGINGYSTDGDLGCVIDPKDDENILYVQCEMPFDISYKDEEGNIVDLDYDDYVNSDHTLKMSEDGKTPLLEVDFPGSTNFVAYRIPTERAYSMINLQVKRFTRKTEGGTIKIPPQFTTVAGFDFDIDKLYFMRREYIRSASYKEEKFTSEEKIAIFNRIYENHRDIESKLIEIRASSEDSNHPLNYYWDQMLAENPSWASDESYNKNNLFNEAVEELIDEGELEAKTANKMYQLDEYDYSKPPLENSKAARNNMLIDLIQQRLMDSETKSQRYTPGGFANSSKAARTLRELLYGDEKELGSNNVLGVAQNNANNKDRKDPEPNYDPSDPMTMVIYNQQNQVASKLIGIFANQNTNHAFASLMKEFRLDNTTIAFAGHSYKDFLHAPNGVDVNLHVAELLAASVDAVKDPVLNFLNLNTVTADSGAMLIRLGYTPLEVGLLFNQPIIKELCDECFNKGIGTEMAIGILMDKYTKNLKTAHDFNSKNKKRNSELLTSDKLAKNIVVSRKEGNEAMKEDHFIKGQLEVLDLFREINITSGEVSQLITSTKFTASNAVGSTFGDLYAQQMRVRKYIDSFGKEGSKIKMSLTDNIEIPINTRADVTNMPQRNQYKSFSDYQKAVRKYNAEYMQSVIYNPFAYEQAMFDANRCALISLAKYYPYETKVYTDARNKLASLTRSGVLDARTINSIHSELMVYMLSNQRKSLFSGETLHDPNYEGVTNREYYNNIFPKELLTTLNNNKKLKKKAIFKYLIPNFEGFEKDDEGTIIGENLSIRMQGIGGMESNAVNEIMESWADLLKDSSTKKLAIDLFMYNYYTLGFNFSPNSFMNLAPTEVKQAIIVEEDLPQGGSKKRTYVEFLRDVLADKIYVNIATFAAQYLLNNTHRKEFVLEPKSENLIKYLNTKANLNSNTVSQPSKSFTVDISVTNGPNRMTDSDVNSIVFKGKRKEGERLFAPIIKLVNNGNTYYYVAESLDPVEGTVMTYIRCDRLGVRGKSIQYLGDDQGPTTYKIPVNQQGDNGDGGGTDVENPIVPPGERYIIFDGSSYVDFLVEANNRFEKNPAPEGDMRKAINKISQSELEIVVNNTISNLRKAGIKVLNKEGKEVDAC